MKGPIRYYCRCVAMDYHSSVVLFGGLCVCVYVRKRERREKELCLPWMMRGGERITM